MQSDEILRRLRALDTACLCDAEKAAPIGLRVMSPELRPIRTGLKLAGRAHTVTCRDDFLTVIKALRDSQPGEVIVIDSQNSRKALTGELFPTEARRKGLMGIINDGPCRDTVAVRTLDIPYYARSVCCIPGTTNRLFETQIAIQCGGVTVNPGEFIFADDDGILVATAEEFETLIPLAEETQRKEEVLLQRMAEGVSLLDMLNFDEHCDSIQKGRASRLEFRV